MNSSLARIAYVLLSLLLVNNAGAYQYSFDSFTVTRNGSTFFNDTFSDGLPPPNGPNGPTTYLMSGTMGPENVGGNGKLLLTTAGGVFSNGLLGDSPNLSQSARLNTNVNSLDTVNGLKENFSFSVMATLDLTSLAMAVGDLGGLRIEDRVPGVNSGLGNDIVDLRLGNPAGTPSILFKDTNQFLGTSVTYEIPLEAGHDQIDLILDHTTAGNATIFGRYEYVDGGVGQGVNSFGSTFDIFNGETFTRAVIVASGLAPIPEPETYAMMLAGLGILGGVSHRRKRRTT